MRWTLIGLALGVSVTVWVTGAVIYVIWLRHEAHKLVRRPASPGLKRKRVS